MALQNKITLNSFWNLSRSEILLIILGLPVCFGVGIFLAAEKYVFALGLLSILLVLITILFPYLGVLFFIFFTYVRPQDYVPGIAGKPIVLISTIIAFGGWLAQVVAQKKREFVNTPQNYLLLGLLLVVILSTIKIGLFYAMESFIEILKIIFLYILVVNLVNTHQKFNVAFWLTFIFTVYIAVLGILQYYDINVAGESFNELGRGRRIIGVGIFNNPNYLAYCVSFMLPASVCLVFYGRLLSAKFFTFLVFCALVFCIYLTKSRGGYLCALLTIGFLLFQNRSNKVKLIGASAVLIIMLVLIKIVPVLVSVGAYQNDASAMGRVESWEIGFRLLLNSPLFGVGYGQWLEFHRTAAHNSFVEIGTELGITGLFIWIGLLYWSYKYLALINEGSSAVNTFLPKIYAQSLRATLFAYVIASFFANISYFILLYIFVSLISAAGQIYIPKEKLRELNRVRAKDLCIIGLVELLVLFVWRIFPYL